MPAVGARPRIEWMPDADPEEPDHEPDDDLETPSFDPYVWLSLLRVEVTEDLRGVPFS